MRKRGDQFQKCIRAQFQSSGRTTMAIRRISRSHVKLWNNGKLDRVRSNIRVTCIVVLSKRYIFFKRRRHWSSTFAFSPVVRLEAKVGATAAAFSQRRSAGKVTLRRSISIPLFLRPPCFRVCAPPSIILSARRFQFALFLRHYQGPKLAQNCI